MRQKNLLASLFILTASVVMAQNDTSHKMSDMQKANAAKADAYLINSNKKITNSFTTHKDSTAVTKKLKKQSCKKRNKKSS